MLKSSGDQQHKLITSFPTIKVPVLYSWKHYCNETELVRLVLQLHVGEPLTNKADNGEGSSNDTRKRVRILAEEWLLQWPKLTGWLSQVASYHRTLQVIILPHGQI